MSRHRFGSFLLFIPSSAAIKDDRHYSAAQIETQLATIFAAADLMTIKSAYTAFDDDKEIADVESEYQRIMSINISDAIDVLKQKTPPKRHPFVQV